MKDIKDRTWDALRIYYGITGSLKFQDENCTQTIYNDTLYIYTANTPKFFPPTKTEKYSKAYFVTWRPDNISFMRCIAPQYGCFCYANNYGLGYLFTVIPPNYKAHKQ